MSNAKYNAKENKSKAGYSEFRSQDETSLNYGDAKKQAHHSTADDTNNRKFTSHKIFENDKSGSNVSKPTQ